MGSGKPSNEKLYQNVLADTLVEMAKVGANNSLPLLRYVLFEPDGACTVLTATDLEHSISRRIDGRVEARVLLPARQLHALVKPDKKSEAGMVGIRKGIVNRSVIDVDGMEIELEGIEPGEWPDLSALRPAGSMRGVTVAHDRFGWVQIAMGANETRTNLQCVLVDAGTGKLICTDGHRLHVIVPDEIDAEHDFNVPASAVKALARISAKEKGDVRIEFDEKTMCALVDGGWEIHAKGNEGEFPPWGRVVPDKKGATVGITFRAGDVRKVASKIKKLFKSTDDSGIQHITFEVFRDGNVEVSTRPLNSKEIKFNVETSVTILNARYFGDEPACFREEKKSLRFSSNADYFLDAFAYAKDSEKIIMTVEDDLSPYIFETDGRPEYFAIVMPFRV